jgi:hypothetical protein
MLGSIIQFKSASELSKKITLAVQIQYNTCVTHSLKIYIKYVCGSHTCVRLSIDDELVIYIRGRYTARQVFEQG